MAPQWVKKSITSAQEAPNDVTVVNDVPFAGKGIPWAASRATKKAEEREKKRGKRKRWIGEVAASSAIGELGCLSLYYRGLRVDAMRSQHHLTRTRSRKTPRSARTAAYYQNTRHLSSCNSCGPQGLCVTICCDRSATLRAG